MKISDEIRDWVNKPEPKLKPLLKLLDLADRIDNEMVELPRDADGVPICVGDTLYDCKGGHQFQVRALRLEDAWGISTNYGFASASSVTHERPDSFERIAEDIEAAEDWRDGDGEYGTGVSSVEESTLHEWADRIRKLAKVEGE